jgi:hypothetical protein
MKTHKEKSTASFEVFKLRSNLSSMLLTNYKICNINSVLFIRFLFSFVKYISQRNVIFFSCCAVCVCLLKEYISISQSTRLVQSNLNL